MNGGRRRTNILVRRLVITDRKGIDKVYHLMLIRCDTGFAGHVVPGILLKDLTMCQYEKEEEGTTYICRLHLEESECAYVVKNITY